jgi:hypothetical protein
VGGGAWPFLVGGAICLVDSDNERDSSLLNRRSITGRLSVGWALACFGARVLLAGVGIVERSFNTTS